MSPLKFFVAFLCACFASFTISSPCLSVSLCHCFPFSLSLLLCACGLPLSLCSQGPWTDSWEPPVHQEVQHVRLHPSKSRLGCFYRSSSHPSGQRVPRAPIQGFTWLLPDIHSQHVPFGQVPGTGPSGGWGAASKMESILGISPVH